MGVTERLEILSGIDARQTMTDALEVINGQTRVIEVLMQCLYSAKTMNRIVNGTATHLAEERSKTDIESLISAFREQYPSIQIRDFSVRSEKTNGQ